MTLAAYLKDLGYPDIYRQEAAPEPAKLAKRRSGAEKEPSSVAVPESAAGGLERFALEQLDQHIQNCRLCRLCEKRQRVVFGTGDPQARLMLIGEGPGAQEDRQGLPFVGPAGQLLDRILEAMGYRRREVYIANIVKCRPPGNRDPQPDEVASCRPYLERQIDLIEPRVIVALGRVAAQTLLGTDLPLGRMRGRWHRVRGVEARVTYHPAGLLRNAAWKRPTWEDMQIVRDRLQS